MLVKESAQLRSRDLGGRFGKDSFLGDMYPALYSKVSIYRAVDKWGQIAREAWVSKAALVYRWVVYHIALKGEKGDGVIIGSRNIDQLEETLTVIKARPLDQGTAERAGGVWEKVRDEAPRDNWNDYLSLKL